MLLRRLVLSGATALPLTLACAQTPAFPGAVGFGSAATGGRGGNVYHVTNLNDSGAGSFRDAVSAPGRTVVFDVGGYITLETECGVKSNMTIAGQTAPGGGIAIRGAEVTFGNQSNIICRFVRFRPGGDSGTTQNGLSLYQAKNVILDHCSVAFAKWNDIDAVSEDWQNKPVRDITVQHSLIANPIGQQFGAHTECVEGTWCWLGNVFANGHNRQPLAKIHTLFVNNTVYNYSAAYTTHTSTRFKHDIVNNYFIAGPASAGTDNTWFQIDRNQSIYTSGNYKDRDRDGTLDGTVTTPYWYQGTGTVLTAPWSPVTATLPTLTAVQAVVRNNCEAGALPRDAMDALVLSQVKTLGLGTTGRGAGTAGPDGGLYTSHAQTGLPDGGWGVISDGTTPVDSDRDGMPDDWEAARGLNAGNAADGRTVVASGYSNLEEYLHWLALPHAFVARNTGAPATAVELDLRPWLGGFPEGVAVTVSGVTGGTVVQSGPGGAVASFTPTPNTSGLAGFTFSATGGDYTLTKQAIVLVSPNAPPRNMRWKGDSAANAWNTSAVNWTNLDTGAAAAFQNGDRVTLDDSGSATPAITLSGALSPTSVRKTGSKNYTVAGSGSLGGAMALAVDGTGTLTLANAANSFTGGTFIDGGHLALAGAATLGSGVVTFTGNSVLTSNYAAGSLLNLGANVISVAEGDTATLNLSAKTAVGGGSGAGTVSVNVKGTAGITSGDYFTGSWADFAGTLNLTGAVAGARCDLNINGGDFDDFGGATLVLDAVRVQSRHNSGGNTIAIGSLDGTSTATLGGSSYAGGATYQIGGKGQPGVFDGAITDGVAPTTVTKVGGSTLHLAGPHTHTGATNVREGTLYASGAFSGLLNVAGGSLSPRTAASVTGQIQANGGLTLDDGTLSLDLSSSPTGNNDKVTCPTGTTLTLNGTNRFLLKFTDGHLSPGTYPLVDGNATLVRESGVVLNHTSPLPTGSRQSLQVVRNSSTTPVPAYVHLIVTGALADLTWTGANGGVWDLTNTQAWTSHAAADPLRFYNFDSVAFTDASPGGTVTLAGSLVPRVAVVSAESKDHTFAGSGTLDGAATLEKTGAGTLTIASTGASTFTGGTRLESGTLRLDTAAATPLGTGTVRVHGGVLHLGVARSLPNSVEFSADATVASTSGNVSLVSDPTRTLRSTAPVSVSFSIPSGICTLQGGMDGFAGTIGLGASNGMLRLNGSTNANFGSAAAHFHLGTGNARLANRNGDVTVAFGAVSGGPGTVLQGRQSGSGDTVSTYLVGGLGTDATFAGSIQTGGDSALNVVKVGSGNWTLAGGSSWTGDMTVQAGRLTVAGSLAATGNVTVRPSATLTLDAGTLTSPLVEIEPGGTLDGCGTLHADVVNHGTLRVACTGGLTVDGALENHGLVIVTHGSQLLLQGAVDNAGTLDFIGSPLTTLPAQFTNTGTVLDATHVRIESASRTGDTLTVVIRTHPGHTYQLQSSTLDGTWTAVTANVSAVTTPDGVKTYTVTGLGSGAAFFRIAVGP